MTGSELLPVAVYKNQLYFLFGKENKMDDSPGYCGFGGGQKGTETFMDTAIREATEELNGFFGLEKDLKKKVNKNIIHTIKYQSYKSFIYLIQYDEQLPIYFNNNFEFLSKKLPHLIKNTNNGLLEKEQIKWFSVKDIKQNKNKFRNFYKNLIEMIVQDIPIIQKNIKKKRKATIKNKRSKNNYTIKHTK